MREYFLSVFLGLIVGAGYSLLGTRPPAPPLVMMVGLLGMLVGDGAINFLRKLIMI